MMTNIMPMNRTTMKIKLTGMSMIDARKKSRKSFIITMIMMFMFMVAVMLQLTWIPGGTSPIGTIHLIRGTPEDITILTGAMILIGTIPIILIIMFPIVGGDITTITTGMVVMWRLLSIIQSMLVVEARAMTATQLRDARLGDAA